MLKILVQEILHPKNRPGGSCRRQSSKVSRIPGVGLAVRLRFRCGDNAAEEALSIDAVETGLRDRIELDDERSALFVQRKVSGTALLGARIGAVVNIHAIVRDVLERTGDLS